MRTYFDVVSCSVDAADGPDCTAKAALIHVAGNGAAKTAVAEKSKAAFGTKRRRELIGHLETEMAF